MKKLLIILTLALCSATSGMAQSGRLAALTEWAMEDKTGQPDFELYLLYTNGSEEVT
jgi:hypothetical protein